ncbi:MAG: SRPBCC family protein [Candidatus Nanopelagicales bacterium]
MRITRTVDSPRAISDVFAYLSDFTTTTEWDPGTVLTTRLSGDGGLGTVYANTSSFNGRQTELVYTVTVFEPNQQVQLQGENRTVHATDTMSFQALKHGTRVTYDAHFRFKGLAVLAQPLLVRAFKHLGDEAEAGLRRALAG